MSSYTIQGAYANFKEAEGNHPFHLVFSPRVSMCTMGPKRGFGG